MRQNAVLIAYGQIPGQLTAHPLVVLELPDDHNRAMYHRLAVMSAQAYYGRYTSNIADECCSQMETIHSGKYSHNATGADPCSFQYGKCHQFADEFSACKGEPRLLHLARNLCKARHPESWI